jgi:hypothetical protein
MNPRFFLRRHPQENRENVVKSENSKPKNETFGEKLTTEPSSRQMREIAPLLGYSPMKKGDRESLSPFVNGGGWLTTQELSISTQACQRVLGRECEVET